MLQLLQHGAISTTHIHAPAAVDIDAVARITAGAASGASAGTTTSATSAAGVSDPVATTGTGCIRRGGADFTAVTFIATATAAGANPDAFITAASAAATTTGAISFAAHSAVHNPASATAATLPGAGAIVFPFKSTITLGSGSPKMKAKVTVAVLGFSVKGTFKGTK